MILMITDWDAMRVNNFDRNYRFLVLFINKLINGDYVLMVIIGRLFYVSYHYHIVFHYGEIKFSKSTSLSTDISNTTAAEDMNHGIKIEKTLQSKFVEKNPDHSNYVVAILTTEHSLL